jgi:hypothetical protein
MTATSVIHGDSFDALVKPIEDAPDSKAARSAVWAVLRTVKADHWRARGDALKDILAVVDAAAWVAGLSMAFRSDSINTATGALGEDLYQVIPAYFDSLCLA